MENLPGLPPIIETVLGQKGSAMLQGLQSFFEKPAGNGSALERSRRSVESAAKEIFFIEKVLSDG
jgi:hypothetical protein